MVSALVLKLYHPDGFSSQNELQLVDKGEKVY